MPNVEYTYKISWKVPERAPTGIYHFDVCLNYGGAPIDSGTGSMVTVA